jgi:two-component system, response regulator YesN
MFHVLIVEDEMLVRHGLKSMVNWSKYNMTIIADASNGLEAWEIYQKERPDLIITDIKMPIMDGIELISKIRSEDTDTKIVILSCMEEFQLVRKAMSLGVSEYILKLTMSNEEIENILKKISDELNKSNNSSDFTSISEPEKNLIKENLFKDYLFNDRYTEKEFSSKLSKLGSFLTSSRLVVCVMEVMHYNRMKEEFKDERGYRIRSSVFNIASDILKSYNNGEIIHDNDGRHIIFLSFEDAVSEQKVFESLGRIIDKIIDNLKMYFSISASFGVSGINSGFQLLFPMYGEALKNLESKFYSGSGVFFHFNADNVKEPTAQKLSKLINSPEIKDHYDPFTLQNYNAIVQSLIENLPESCNLFYSEFCKILQQTLSLLNITGKDVSQFLASFTDRLKSSETIDDMIDLYVSFLRELNTIKNSQNINNKVISDAIDYIEKNYMTDISLHDVAGRIGLSPNYLSSLFKKELQINYCDYLINIRIEKAKQMLLKSDLKLYEIAEKTGFSDNTYFCKTFKKLTGMSPKDFKKEKINKVFGKVI